MDEFLFLELPQQNTRRDVGAVQKLYRLGMGGGGVAPKMIN